MKITVCTNAINKWYRNVVKYALRGFKLYCDKHNYNFVLHTEETENTFYDKTRDIPWYKILLIKNLLEKNDSDYIVWIDADCQILNYDVKLEHFIELYLENENHNKDLALIQECPLNTGVMFLKNTDFNTKLMQQIWDNVHDGPFHEQESICKLYTTDENIRKKIYVIPPPEQFKLVIYYGNYYPGNSFLIHAARCSTDIKGFIHTMDMFCFLKLDDESIEQYNKRIEWLTNVELCRKDLDIYIERKITNFPLSQRLINYIVFENKIILAGKKILKTIRKYILKKKLKNKINGL